MEVKWGLWESWIYSGTCLENLWSSRVGGWKIVMETREIYQRDYLPIHILYGNQRVLLHFYSIFFCMTSHIILQNLSSTDLKALIYVGKKFFFSDRSSHMCFALEPDCRLLLTLRVNSGGLRWVEIACLMFSFLHFSKQQSLWLLSQNNPDR